MAQGKERFDTIDKDSWNMILGKMGKLPGKLAPEIVEKAKKERLEFYTGNPQDAYPDALDEYRKEMKENGWDFGQDDEELFELAMHDRQYRDYKSGVAKERFNKELEAAREKAGAPIIVSRRVVEIPKFDVKRVMELHPTAQPVQSPVKGKLMWQYDVSDSSSAPVVGSSVKKGDILCYIQAYYGVEEVCALADGKIIQIETEQGADVVKDEVLAFVG